MYEETHTQVYVSTYELTYDFTAIKAWWSNFMQKVLVYCETWCVQFRFLSLTIPKSYNSMMLESCSYFFAHRLSFCCQCKHSPRAGLEPPELQSWLLTYKWLVLLFPHHLFTHVMVKLIGTRIYTVLMSVFATQLRSKEATVRWKDRDRSEDPLEHSVYMHRKCESSVCISYSSWGSDKIPDNSSLRLTVWGSSGIFGREVMEAGVQSSWSHCISESRCKEKWMLSSHFTLSSCLGAVHIHCRSFWLY